MPNVIKHLHINLCNIICFQITNKMILASSQLRKAGCCIQCVSVTWWPRPLELYTQTQRGVFQWKGRASVTRFIIFFSSPQVDEVGFSLYRLLQSLLLPLCQQLPHFLSEILMQLAEVLHRLRPLRDAGCRLGGVSLRPKFRRASGGLLAAGGRGL